MGSSELREIVWLLKQLVQQHADGQRKQYATQQEPRKVEDKLPPVLRAELKLPHEIVAAEYAQRNKRAQSERDRLDSDKEQRKVEYWKLGLEGLTFLGVIVTIAITYYTFDQMRSQTGAAVLAADSAAEQTRLNRQQLEFLSAAQLEIRKPYLDFDSSQLSILFRNVGKTMSEHGAAMIERTIVTIPGNNPIGEPWTTTQPISNIVPAEVNDAPGSIGLLNWEHSISLTDAQIQDFNSGRIAIAFKVIVAYYNGFRYIHDRACYAFMRYPKPSGGFENSDCPCVDLPAKVAWFQDMKPKWSGSK